MSKVLIIGYGNTLRGDDAAGIRAAELVALRHPEYACVCMHQLMPEMAEEIAECDAVFFLDADVSVLQPTARSVGPLLEAEQPRSHFISPESLLSLSRQLYRKIPSKAFVVGIPASEFEFSEELSEATARAVEECVILVEQKLLA